MSQPLEVETCPDCQSKITDDNPRMAEHHEQHGSCQDCYDPTPAGVEYSPGFEMNH